MIYMANSTVWLADICLVVPGDFHFNSKLLARPTAKLKRNHYIKWTDMYHDSLTLKYLFI
jgi:hypothetical protein